MEFRELSWALVWDLKEASSDFRLAEISSSLVEIVKSLEGAGGEIAYKIASHAQRGKFLRCMTCN